jgi:hypothetical protein
MKKIFLLSCLLILGGKSYSQISISGGMGVNYTGSSSFIEYLDRYYPMPDEKLNNGYTTVEFFFEGDYDLKENLTLGLDYAYRLYSYNSSRYAYYEMTYGVHAPSILLYYTIKGKRHRFNLGGGAGVRFASMEESAAMGLGKEKYSATGFGLLLKAAGHTALSDHFYAVISGTIKFDYYGKIQSKTAQAEFDLTSISAGLNLGVSYYF